MKKIVCLLELSLLLFFCMVQTACSREHLDPEKTFQIYSVSNSETKVEAHPVEIQSENTSEQLEELIACLSTMPEKLEYKPPFTFGFEAQQVELKDGMLRIDVDTAYLNLTGTTEVLVRAAIVRTLTQLDDVKYVEITVNGSQLYDNNDELVGWMNAEMFINNDGNAINTYELTRVMLYFANENGDKLIPNYREKHYSTNTPLERFVVEELIAGPSGQVDGIYPSINPETKIVSISTKDGICYVNLDSAFLTVTGNVSTDISIYSIVNSLVELNNINKVQILINGEVPTSFQSTYERNLDYVTTLDM
ncbi:MAG: GerMN domain-containing protein [Lachnospiraceae bacterium]|nr:GerMN domain-containing protein [Lachnospiraceae bacterium]